jgi:hypothetical protein
MAAIITNKFRTFNVESFLKGLEGATPLNYLYFFIGKATPWADDSDLGAVGSDTVPPQPVDSLSDENSIWRNMMSLKRIQRSSATSGIVKRNWVYGTYYDIYRHDYGLTGVTGLSETGVTTVPKTLSEARYYVVTDNGSVYMCIDNNNGLNASTINPQNYGTGIGFNIIETSDGYKWKYVAGVSASDFASFSTLEFHPVKVILTEPPVNDPYENQYLAQEHSKTHGGAIFNIKVKAAGTSLHRSTTITMASSSDFSVFKVYGDGSGLRLSASTNSSGGVSSITVLDPGTNYTYCYVTLTGFNGVSLYPIFTPKYGLGADPVKDLNAYYLLINATLTYAEGDGDFTVANDYRQVGLLANPYNFGTSTYSNMGSLDATISVMVSETTAAFTVDSEIVNNTNGTRAKIIDWDPAYVDSILGTVGRLRLNYAKPTDNTTWTTNAGFSVGHSISQTGGNGSTQGLTVDKVVNPEIQAYSGNILYFENRRPILRDATQIEEIHLILEF